MEKLKSLLRWWLLLNKRLLKRPGFWAVILAVPVLVAGLTLAASRDSGLVRIAVGLEAPEDPIAREAADRLLARNSVLDLRLCQDASQAETMVRTGRADAAWLFPADLTERLAQNAAGDAVPLVTVLEQEDNVLLQLSREKLFAALYPAYSYALFRDFAANRLQATSEQEIRTYYDSVQRDSRFIVFSYSGIGQADPLETSYLVAPARGLMALLLLLGALVSAMYYTREAAAFVWLSRKKRILLPFACHLILLLDLAVPVLLALWLSGLITAWGWELLLLGLYCLACAGFAEVLRGLLGTARRLGTALPLILLAGLALCPIFLNVRRFPAIQYLLPPFLYLHGIHSGAFCLYLVVYVCLSWGLGLLLARVRGPLERTDAV